MANYYVNEAVFDLPERPFVDKTVHALECGLPEDQKLAVFVHRRPIEGGKSLRDLVDESIALNVARLAAYTVLDDVRADVGGLPGILLRTRWRLEGATYQQRQAHVAVDGKLVTFAVTVPDAEQAAGDETFESILSTVTWRMG
ncbi:MAG: DcrB-related protein [Minicystis sp.]